LLSFFLRAIFIYFLSSCNPVYSIHTVAKNLFHMD